MLVDEKTLNTPDGTTDEVMSNGASLRPDFGELEHLSDAAKAILSEAQEQ